MLEDLPGGEYNIACSSRLFVSRWAFDAAKQQRLLVLVLGVRKNTVKVMG